jgi:hypothetical protein
MAAKPPELTVAEFLLAVLERCPRGSRIEFDQCEGPRLALALREWSFPQQREVPEADYYEVDERFVARFRELLLAHPKELDCCHHLSIVGPNGAVLLASYDNFHPIMKLDPAIQAHVESVVRQKVAGGRAGQRPDA